MGKWEQHPLLSGFMRRRRYDLEEANPKLGKIYEVTEKS